MDQKRQTDELLRTDQDASALMRKLQLASQPLTPVDGKYKMAEFEPDDDLDLMLDESAAATFYGSCVFCLTLDLHTFSPPCRLLDPQKRPSDMFKYLADALFFYMDQEYDNLMMRNSGYIEPQKYIWLLLLQGTPEQDVRVKSAWFTSY